MTAIVYIGNKQTKPDNVANTGVEWNGYGDIQNVPDDKAPIFLNPKHKDIWALAVNSDEIPEGASRLATHNDIIVAINKLNEHDRVTDFTKSGSPRLPATVKALGQKITQEQLDDAWNSILEARFPKDKA